MAGMPSGYVSYFYNEESSSAINNLYDKKNQLWNQQKRQFARRKKMSSRNKSSATTQDLFTLVQQFSDGDVLPSFQKSLDIAMNSAKKGGLSKISSSAQFQGSDGQSLESVSRKKVMAALKNQDEYITQYANFLGTLQDIIDKAAKILQTEGVNNLQAVIFERLVEELENNGETAGKGYRAKTEQNKIGQNIADQIYGHLMRAEGLAIDRELVAAEKAVAESLNIPLLLVRMVEMEKLLQSSPEGEVIGSVNNTFSRVKSSGDLSEGNFLFHAVNKAAGWAKGLVGAVGEVVAAAGLQDLSDELINELNLGFEKLTFSSGGGSSHAQFKPSKESRRMRARGDAASVKSNVTKEDIKIVARKDGVDIYVGGISVKTITPKIKSIGQGFERIHLKSDTNLGALLETTVALGRGGATFRTAFYNIAVNRPRGRRWSKGDAGQLQEAWRKAFEILKIVSLIDALAGRGVRNNNVISLIVNGKLLSIEDIIEDLSKDEDSTNFKLLWNPVARDYFAKRAFFISTDMEYLTGQPSGKVPGKNKELSWDYAMKRSQDTEDMLLQDMYRRKMTVSLGVGNSFFK